MKKKKKKKQKMFLSCPPAPEVESLASPDAGALAMRTVKSQLQNCKTKLKGTNGR